MRQLAPWTAVPLALCALAWPATSGAVTITLGRPNLSASLDASESCEGTAGSGCQSTGGFNSALSGPGAVLAAPADGTITSWRARGIMSGSGRLDLTVVRSQADGSFTATAVSPNASAADGSGNTVNLPVAVGDKIGWFGYRSFDMSGYTGDTGMYATSAPGGSRGYVFTGSVGANSTLTSPVPNQEFLYNATVDLFAPGLSSISPNSGTAGTVVTITGQHLAVVTGVTFGGVPATNVSGDNGRVTATAPARPQGGAVDVQVTTAGGTSVGLPLDVFTYPTPPPGPATAPKVSSVALSPARFRAVNAGGSVFAVKTGTRVSYSLSEVATTTFTVKRAKSGRRVGKRCVAPKRSNRRKRRCTRLVAVRGSFKLAGVTGANRFNFSGRMNRRALAPGGYRLYAVAKTAAGKTSRTASRAFHIVRQPARA